MTIPLPYLQTSSKKTMTSPLPCSSKKKRKNENAKKPLNAVVTTSSLKPTSTTPIHQAGVRFQALAVEPLVHKMAPLHHLVGVAAHGKLRARIDHRRPGNPACQRTHRPQLMSKLPKGQRIFLQRPTLRIPMHHLVPALVPPVLLGRYPADHEYRVRTVSMPRRIVLRLPMVLVDRGEEGICQDHPPAEEVLVGVWTRVWCVEGVEGRIRWCRQKTKKRIRIRIVL